MRRADPKGAQAARHITRVIQSVERWQRTPAEIPEGSEARCIIQSWGRCLTSYGLDPNARNVAIVLDDAALRERRQAMGALYDIAHAELENLYLQTAGSGYAVILTDAGGAIVAHIGDPALDREFLNAGLWHGADWSESRAGTNGIGTCIEERRPVIIHRDEHFLSCNIALSCSGTPIYLPDGSLGAVLDASSVNSRDTRQSQLHTMALVRMSARLIENSYFLSAYCNHWILRFHGRPEFVGLLHEGMLALDEAGTVLATNQSAVGQLAQESRRDLIGRCIDTILDIAPQNLQAWALGEGQTTWPVRDLAHGKRYFAMLRGPLQPPRRMPPPARVIRPLRSGPVRGRALALNDLLVGGDPRMAYIVRCAERLVDKDVAIILQGETGTGKEAMAQAIHGASSRAEQPFVAINCASIPASLIESELFGYRRGAFTGARKEGMRGKIIQASGGTLFLDEIGDMPAELQTRLLRVLEQREVLPLGSETPVAVDLHVISATHRNLEDRLREGSFREDLYYRLNGITLTLPPLRERRDKEELIRAILAVETDREAEVGIEEEAFHCLEAYDWPGNIRQLRNCLRTALALCDRGIIRRKDLPPEIVTPGKPPQTGTAAIGHDPVQPETAPTPVNALEEAVRQTLLQELRRHRWNISRTARSLGTSRNTLYRKLRRHGIDTAQGE